ncbi:MBL fold metallo-hydrolase [bacterium]|nr:MBL fold metallo-hydrolase [bacterium]
MRVHSSLHPKNQVRSYLVVSDTKDAVLIDSGAPVEPIVSFLEENTLSLATVLTTHHHFDHVEHNGFYQERYHCEFWGPEKERDLLPGYDRYLAPGEQFRLLSFQGEAIHTPGHSPGMMVYLFDKRVAFTGDTLFRGSVGGTESFRKEGGANYEDLRSSILHEILSFPDHTILYPGHGEPSTIERERSSNPFLLFFQNEERSLQEQRTVRGETVLLHVEAEDYDGGTKCLVEFSNRRREIVPGSKVNALTEIVGRNPS